MAQGRKPLLAGIIEADWNALYCDDVESFRTIIGLNVSGYRIHGSYGSFRIVQAAPPLYTFSHPGLSQGDLFDSSRHCIGLIPIIHLTKLAGATAPIVAYRVLP